MRLEYLAVFFFFFFFSVIDQANERDEPLVYNLCQTEANTFNDSELFSLVHQDIIDTYAIPREAVRETVRMVSSIVQRNQIRNNSLGKYFRFSA